MLMLVLCLVLIVLSENSKTINKKFKKKIFPYLSVFVIFNIYYFYYFIYIYITVHGCGGCIDADVRNQPVCDGTPIAKTKVERYQEVIGIYDIKR